MEHFTATPEGNLLANGQPIANFVPQLICGYWNADQGATGPPVALEVRFKLKGQSNEQSATIAYQQLDRFSFEAEFPGCICSDSKGKSTQSRVIRYIREQLGALSSRNMYGVYYPVSGWYIHSSGPRYIAGRQIIGVETEQPVLIHRSVKALHFISDSHLTACMAVEQLVQILHKMPRFMLPVYAFTLYASLRSIIRAEGLPTACVLYLVGKQGYGKTTAAKRFCTLYNDAAGRPADIFDALSTEAAMVDALAGARDRVVLLDDVCRSTSAGNQRKRQNLAAYLTKAAANETPLSRKRGKETELVECTASLVITGEIPLETASDLTRCITVEINQRLTTGSKEDRVAAASAIAGFLQWFAENSEQERAKLRTDFASFEAKNRSHREERLQKSLWELSWVFASFLRFAVSVGAVSERAASQMDNELASQIQQIYVNTLQKVDRFGTLDALCSVISSGAKAKKFPCFQHKGCLCVSTENLTAYLRLQSGQFALSVNDVTALLRSKGLLRMDKSGKSTRKVGKARMLTIPLDKLAE